MKQDYSINKQLQDDIIRAYTKVCGTSWTSKEAFEKVSKMPAPRYYVSAKHAFQVISRMVKNDFEQVDAMRPNRRRMYYSLFENVLQLSEQRDFIGRSLWHIMKFAVISPAPEFFLSPKRLERIRILIKQQLIDNDGRYLPTKSSIRSYQRLSEKRNKLKKKTQCEK